ncbi:MAG: vitamin K epoxide reductase family protein [Anaerolineales bacterium]
MADNINPPQTDNTRIAFYWATFGLGCLGFLDSTYLLIYKLTNIPSMCLGAGGCHNVNFSPYSQIGGIPVSVFGMVAYFVIAGILVLEPRLMIAQENGSLAIFGISLAGVAFSAYLTWLEIYVIHAICPFCVASAVIISLIFILAIIRLIKQPAP